MGNLLLGWQEVMFKILTSNEQIKSRVTGIYTHLPQDSKFPYIHIGKFEIKDWSSCTNIGFIVISNIGIYSRERNNKILFDLFALIKEAFAEANFTLRDYHLITHNLLSAEISQSNDGLTSSLLIKFKSLIEEKNK